jgi:hypothetical protein
MHEARNLRSGANKIGIPGLIIMQNAVQNSLFLFTLDARFKLMADAFPLKLYSP